MSLDIRWDPHPWPHKAPTPCHLPAHHHHAHLVTRWGEYKFDTQVTGADLDAWGSEIKGGQES